MLLDGSMINLSFFVILRYIVRKWLLKRRLASILPLNSKLPGKFQRFNAIDGSIEMPIIVELPKIQIKTIISKRFMSLKQGAPWKKLFR